jgi:hypothetical protein
MGLSPTAARLTARLALLLFLAPAFSGCSGGGFSVDLDLWHAGYAWEYDETLRDSIEIKGEPPSSLSADEEEGSMQENRTLRVEIFNSTAGSVEGIPIYVAAVQTITIPENNSEEGGEQEEPTEEWAVWVYTADFNVVEPTYVEWRNQEVQLSGEEGGVAEGEDEASNDTNNQPQNEARLLDWPLSKNKRWRHIEQVNDLDAEGVYDGRVSGKGSQTVPAGKFDVVRLGGKLAPDDTQDIEDGIADSLESQGGEVDRISFSYSVNYEYSYSEKVLNFVSYKQTIKIVLSAEGKDEDGKAYDFTFTQTKVTERKLATYQLEAGVEKPLTFAVDVERGLYAPKPITPASHLAVEILATSQSVNAGADEKVTFGVRIYNSTAGEKKLRGPEESYPHVQSGINAPAYDHSYLEIVWHLDSVDRRNNLREFRAETSDSLTLKGADFAGHGWKQVRATLQLKNAENTTDPTIFTDFVAFEVYYHGNMTYTRMAQNVSGPDPRVSFPVEPSATRVTVKGLVKDVPAELQCPVAGTQDCIRVNDASNRNVQDQRSTRMEFETTTLGQYQYGTWSAVYNPSQPSQTVTFEVVVRYRVGA